MKSGSKGLVELDLETGAMGGGAEKDKVGEDVDSDHSMPESVNGGGRPIAKGGARASASIGKGVVPTPKTCMHKFKVKVKGER